MKVRDILKVKGSQVYTIGPDPDRSRRGRHSHEAPDRRLLVRDGTGTVSGIISERDVLGQCLHRSADLDRIPSAKS
jgi:hypothetical protein